MFIIYAIVNKTNNKLYIGQTNNIKKRWSQHRYEAFKTNNQKPLYRSIRKHGEKNFKIIQIEKCETIDKTNNAEIFWISFLASHISQKGYNITHGGHKRYDGWNHSERTKKKMSEQRRGSNNSFYGKKHTKKSKEKMSKNPNRKFIGKKNYFYGKKLNGSKNGFAKLTEELVIKIRNEFENFDLTYIVLAKKYNVNETTISRVIKRQTWSHV